jgi:hypothetical protein
LLRHTFISDHSRKAKLARQLYDHLRQKVPRDQWIPKTVWENFHGESGIPVPDSDKSRVLNLRLVDEHLSPYVKTDLNLFQLHMMDESVHIVIYRAQNGWLLTFDGVAEGPKPFGQNGFDTR